ncbi:hypothetical protein CDW55_01820 [Chryseobacterium sp. VAUSW3]|nr:hypothetical protein CDW55_01820 [Chryseobacterium sp. VAUSW3]
MPARDGRWEILDDGRWKMGDGRGKRYAGMGCTMLGVSVDLVGWWISGLVDWWKNAGPGNRKL